MAQGCLNWESSPLDTLSGAHKGMLDAFKPLANATDEEILEFAKHYGVLGLCEHRLPYSHAPAAIHNRSSLEPEPKGCLPLQVEKLANWRWYAQGFQAALNAAAQLENGKLPDEADWNILMNDSVMGWKEEQVPKISRNTNLAIVIVSLRLDRVLNGLLRLGGVNLAVQRRDGGDWRAAWHCGPVIPETRIRVGGGASLPAVVESKLSAYRVNTFGHLAIQLVTHIARTDGLALCSACGQAFVIQNRRRSPNRRAYCPGCGVTAARRDAKRDWRQKKRDASR